jgi:4,5-DOPA dioxygenase extradiol
MPRMQTCMPALFFGHGNPLNAIQKNEWTDAWRALGRTLPRPRAILCISAHWYPPATLVTANDQPRTIHDFGGFPRELYEVEYRAPGSPPVADEVVRALKPLDAGLDERWGLDHGTWSVLTHLYPDADVPVLQLSIDESKDPRFHYDAGKRLSALRDSGILVIGSGNIVHNLHTYAWGRTSPAPYDWAVRFETVARAAMQVANDETLIEYEALGQDALLSVPTPEHYLPLLYVLGTRRDTDRVSFPVEGMDGGSVSMLSVMLSSSEAASASR